MKSLPVLMYHDIHNQIYNQYMVVHPNKFYHDMQYIKNNFTTICINDLLNYIYHGVPLPPKCIMITFDDAYSGVYRHAYNILTDLKMKATVSVIVKRINNPTVYEIKKLNWLQMKEMYDSGYIDFQSHSYDMHEPQSINVNQRVGCLIKDGEDIDQYAKKFIEDYL
jgi:peptidoglycan/xylan/chitin deacetylase (PgdA/CDA1 family)